MISKGNPNGCAAYLLNNRYSSESVTIFQIYSVSFTKWFPVESTFESIMILVPPPPMIISQREVHVMPQRRVRSGLQKVWAALKCKFTGGSQAPLW